MKKLKFTISNLVVKSIYEYCAHTCYETGVDAQYSYMLYKNMQILEPAYVDMVKRSYIEEHDAEYMEYTEQLNAIDVSNTADIEKLKLSYKDVIQRHDTQCEKNKQILAECNEFELYALSTTEMPEHVAPKMRTLFGIAFY